jgi:uncharacterized protein
MPATRSAHDEIASPCTGVCKLDTHNLCVGCWRSIDEIIAWPTASREQRLAILERSEQRKPEHEDG